MKIIRINKDGTMNELDIKLPKNPINTLNKNKVSSGNDVLKELYMWKYDTRIIKCYGWYDGEAGFENKHELAPNGSSTFLEEDSSSKLLFGDIFIVALEDNKYSDFCVSDYGMFFEIMNDGFDDLDSCEEDDDGYDQEEFSEDEDYNYNDISSSDDEENNLVNENELLDTDENIY